MKSHKEVGALAELKFTLAALENGFSVSKPYLDARKYDFIIESKQGCFNRIQIKSCNTAAKDGSFSFKLLFGNKKDGFYSKRDIDFFALYVIPENLFFFVPIESVKGVKNVSIYPSENSQSKYSIYRESWHLLELPPLPSNMQ